MLIGTADGIPRAELPLYSTPYWPIAVTTLPVGSTPGWKPATLGAVALPEAAPMVLLEAPSAMTMPSTVVGIGCTVLPLMTLPAMRLPLGPVPTIVTPLA